MNRVADGNEGGLIGWCKRLSLASLIHFEQWDGRDEIKARELLSAISDGKS